jgi:hypothetical protein
MIAIKYVGDNTTFRILLNVMATSALNNPGMTVLEFADRHGYNAGGEL